MKQINNINNIYQNIKEKIISRINEFKLIWKNYSDYEIFIELVFCILTPQSKARTCWAAVEQLILKNMLLSDDYNKISGIINSVRFKNNKAKYIINAKNIFFKNGNCFLKKILTDYTDIFKMREYLVNTVKGIAYKEASHFLRNIGHGDNIAILDRHILRNLVSFGYIKEIPQSISKEKYLFLENKVRELSYDSNIPMDHLDFVLWFKQTNDIFK